ncbi:aldo/keto reductase [Streptomyces acidiscabies]|uniref:aldo/keto reductase n=1 Tax=Streptomyces acidiscabies TaxID=42234 RepID=UPI000952D56E|nr:aldo/keto reductase [Streptomyces acidiscabies]GAV40275.1 general stress protein 69 [Streptomyces acidiscabies]
MRYRTLGRDGLDVSAVGLGCLAMAGVYGPADAARFSELVEQGLRRGLTLIDTADFYGDGANEEMVGRAIAGHRDEVVVATRGGLRAERPGGPPKVLDGRPEYLRTACEASLRRLGVDHIDLYYLGRVDPGVPVEESVGALAALVAEGKIRHIGLSEASADDIRRGHATHPVTALQSEYSLWERHVEAEILPTVRELGIGFVAHTPLGKGFLTRTLTEAGQLRPGDIRLNHPRFQGENFRRNAELVAELDVAVSDTGLSAAQLALVWLLGRGEDVVPIPGTRSAAHLAANLGAMNVHPSPQLMERIGKLVSPEQVTGPRVPVRRGAS